ncbi:MAG: hypothetical protein IJ400_03370 [Clostridia bacterium]|nr:hypothetical protein [Clostridia bacterium]
MSLKIYRDKLAELVRQLKLLAFVFLVELQSLNILFPLLLVLIGIGVVPVNCVLAGVSCLLLVFTIVRHFQESKILQTVKKTVDRVCRIIKILAKAVSLGISIYGIVIIINDVNWFSVLVVVVSAILWIIQVVIEIVRQILERQLAILTQRVKDDYQKAKEKTSQVKDNVGNFVKCLRGDEDADKTRVSSTQQKAIDIFEKGKTTFVGAKNAIVDKIKKKPSDENK